MRRRSRSVIGLLFVSLAVLTAGCGSNDNAGFPDCGNRVLDNGEECDDGNLLDSDGCLSTCKFNVCGDGFVNVGVEQCEGNNFLGATCASNGFVSGTLVCSAQCTIDTSGCTGTAPLPTPTPAATSTPFEGPTPTGGVTPTVGPTPSGSACRDGDQVVVVASLTQAYGAAVINLEYPASVNIPGTGIAPTVIASVQFAASGVTNVSDGDTNGDGVDDTLIAGLLSLNENPAGTFVTVTFDCVTGQAPPDSGAFTCSVVSASTADGVQIPDEQCTVVVQ